MGTDKPNRSDFTDAKEYKRAYDRWRDKNLPSRRARNTDPERHARAREWYAANREAVLEQKKAYFQENKAQIRDYQRDYVKDRYRDDLEFRAKSIKRARSSTVANWEHVKELNSQRYHARPDIQEKVRQRNSEYMAANADKIAEQRAKFRSENRAMLAERQRARLSCATPPWITAEQRQEMVLIYKRAEELTALTGIPHEVDHVWPLKGRKACGLHVPWNLQVLSSKENRRKLNKEPLEQAGAGR